MAIVHDQLVLSQLALRNLLTRAHRGEEPDALVRLCVENASGVRITAMRPPVQDADPDGCCPCRRPWCTGGCQSDGRLER